MAEIKGSSWEPQLYDKEHIVSSFSEINLFNFPESEVKDTFSSHNK